MDGYVKIGTELDTKSFDAQIKEVEVELDEIEHKLKQADMGFEVGDTVKLEAQYEKLSQKLTTLKIKQSDLERMDIRNIENSIKGVGKQVDGVVKKIGKWALAVFGIRTAYMGIRKAISMVRGENEEIDASFKAIESFFATAFEPIVQRLVNWMMILVNYVNYLAKAWFRVDILAKSNEKSLKGVNKQAKELQKTLQSTSFDEENILNDNSSGGVSGTGIEPLPIPEDIPIPSWLEWIKDNGMLTATIIGMISFALLGLKLNIGLIGGLGLGILLAGIIILIKGIVDFIKDPSWDNFLTILQGVALVVAGIAILMGAWIVALIALGVAIVTYLIKNWDKVKEILGVVSSWIYDKVIKPIGDFFAGLWNKIKEVFSNVGNWFKEKFTDAWNGIKLIFSTVGTFFSGVFDKIKSIFKNIGQTIGDVIGSAFKTAINAVLSIADTIINTPIRAINKLIGVINKVPGINLGTLNTVTIPRLKTGGIINLPNRGVPIGGGRAIGGEAGAEGVIPLTDSQAMETLGNAIGRYITLNLTNVTKMDSKTISRQLKTISAEDDFVMNR